MSVQSLLHDKASKVITVEPATHVDTAARLLMRHDIGGLPVIGPDGALLGFLAEREIVQSVDENSGSIQHLPVGSIMRRPAPTCTIGDSLHEVMARMTRDRLRHLVVMDGKRIIGIISVGDLVKHRLQQLETETSVLRDYVAGQRALTGR